MNETTKTITFAVAALLALGAAWLGRPKPIGIDLPDLVGQPLFPDLNDPYDAKSMKIVEYDEDLGELRTFEVAQENGLWVIPSHQDYPADAEETLATAANLLVGLKVINVQSNEKQEHATYGVVRPDVETLRAGDQGVGRLVTLKDSNNSRLAEIVVGEEVTGQPNQRYVRAYDQEPVYIVELDPSKLSTKFEDWVQRDVLDLNGFDIQDITIHDYSANPQLTNQGRLVLNEQDRLRVTARWNADDAQWELDEFEEKVGGQMKPSHLTENEELDREALDGMKQALDDLQIVDVERKPAGLGAELIDDSFWNNQESIMSLFERGFYAAEDASGKANLRSSDGEVRIRTTDGVEYLLRFGQVAGVESGAGENAEEESSDAGGLNRFVMVNANVYEDAFEKPVLDLPDESETTADRAEEEGETADDETADDETADDETAKDEAVEGEAAEGDAEAADEAATDTDDATTSDEGLSDEGLSDEKAADASVEETDDSPVAEPDQRVADALREVKLKEYERKMDEYKSQLKKAQEKVDKLNFRFADWYYVVPEDEYRKIHLGRSDIVRGKESTASEGMDIEAFRMLEETDLDAARPDQEAPSSP
jgi:hypothetical protein